MQIYKLRLKNGFSSMIEKQPSGMPRAVFFKHKKMIVLPLLSGVPSIAPVIMRFQIINMMLVCLFNGLIRPLLPTLLYGPVRFTQIFTYQFIHCIGILIEVYFVDYFAC